MTLTIFSILIPLIATMITIIMGYFEYRLRGKQKRSELYRIYRDKLKSNIAVKKVIKALENDDNSIEKVNRFDKYVFLGFYEDIALLMNTGLIKPDIVHYMFGYYSIKCWDNEVFWKDINRKSHYWRVFREFVAKMKKIEQKNMQFSKDKKIKFKI